MDGGDLLDTDGNDGEFAESRRIENEHAAGLQHLEIRYAKLVIAVPTLLVVPDNDTASGMDTLDRAAIQHRTVTRHMKTMVIKDIEDDMRRLASGKGLAIRAIAQQIEPVSD